MLTWQPLICSAVSAVTPGTFTQTGTVDKNVSAFYHANYLKKILVIAPWLNDLIPIH